jgi:hypothetical protein
MQKRRRQISAWWESLDTEADNLRVNPNLFKQASDPSPDKYRDLNDRPDKVNPDNCYIIREALQKLYQFLTASHADGCSDKSCRYDPKTCAIKIRIKKNNQRDFKGLEGEFKIRKKRGRKSKYELQQMALMQAANAML